jgi:hypothetical protein
MNVTAAATAEIATRALAVQVAMRVAPGSITAAGAPPANAGAESDGPVDGDNPIGRLLDTLA